MACNKQILASILVYLSVLCNIFVEGRTFAEVEDRQIETKEGRSIEANPSALTSNLLSSLFSKQSSDYHIHHAGWYTLTDLFHGTRARISVWGIPEVHPNSESSVFIAVLNDNQSMYSMVAGFHVYPSLYAGSTDLRLFAGWTTSNDNKGCYSTECEGFVLSNVRGAPVPGRKVEPLSTYNGEDHFLTLSIKKDKETKDWSLYRDDNSNQILIGWWPKSLFNNSFDHATKLVWAGGVFYPKNETSPPMGSGHAAYEGKNKAAYISHIKIYDQFDQTTIPDTNRVREFTDRSDCFMTDGFKYSHNDGYYLYYGGPPGCQN